MAQISDAVRAKMQATAQSVRDGMKQSGRTSRVFDLTGKNAIVQPGAAVVGRFLPRWDIGQKVLWQDNQWVPNPQYVDDLVYHVAFEHWWDDKEGKPSRAWCLKNFDENAACPICEAADDLFHSPNGEDRKGAKRIGAKKALLYNFIPGKSGKRALTDQGKPDIGAISVPGPVFVKLSAFMTGSSVKDEADSAFVLGDITDPREGYDIALKRPAAQGDRWDADAARQPSPLFTPQEAQAFQGWMDRLVDLPSMVEKELESYDTLYQRYYGAAPQAAGDDSFNADTPDGGADDGFASVGAPTNSPRTPQAGSAAADPWASHAGPTSPSPAQQPPFTPPAPSAGPRFNPPPGAGRTPPRRPSGRR